MPYGRRLLLLIILITGVAIPAVALRAVCAGNSCGARVAPARVPFCTLPGDLKSLIAAGFREGRSPDVLAVTREADLWGSHDAGNVAAAWPSVSGGPSTAVPIAFSGIGITPRSSVPDGTRLDTVAPTIADIIGFRRPHPEVRSGEALGEVTTGERPRLILQVAWKGIGSADLRAHPGAWRFLRSLIASGSGTLDGDTGSAPLDPAASLTTIGTGGLPSQHGITGTLLRNENGRLTRAWGDDAPLSVIATLADDLDESLGQRPLIGLAATDTADLGIIGGTWYLEHDDDDVRIDRQPAAAAERMLSSGFGRDDVPDILAVVLQGAVPDLDVALRHLVAEARRASNGAVAVIVTGTGSATKPSLAGDRSVSALVAELDARFPSPLVEGATPGGIFLDQQRMAAAGIPGSEVVDALLRLKVNGAPLMADAFQGFAVSFARYC